MYLEYRGDGHFEAATGTLVDSSSSSRDEIVKYKTCMWIEDTRDGGASQFITHINGKQLSRWSQEADKSDEIPLNWRSTSPTPSEKGELRKPVHAHCHCRGVEFWITHPNEASRNAKSPWSDLVIPHYLNKSANLDGFPWWLPGPSNKRFLAGTCACTSCRRASGFDITFWAFIPTANIFLDSDLRTPFPAAGYWGTMKRYESSEDVMRTFCARCGANVLWSGDEKGCGRVGLVDVAVGLLDAESGARAEEVLAWWTGRVSFEEDGLNRGLVRGLEEGLKEWARRNEGKECVARFGGELGGVD
ncbi:Nn.00g083540.m01.CDS01 [Neocucurbitaria sp. VM-36]